MEGGAYKKERFMLSCRRRREKVKEEKDLSWLLRLLDRRISQRTAILFLISLSLNSGFFSFFFFLRWRLNTNEFLTKC